MWQSSGNLASWSWNGDRPGPRDALALWLFDCQWYGTMGTAMSDPSPTPAPPSADEPTDRPRSHWWQAFRRAPRAVRWTAWTAVGLVLVLLVLAAAVVGVVRRPLPQTEGELEVPGLSASVEVVRDANGIAQVYADTDDDLMRAQGFVHAQERFFEMDFRRHVTAGRLSEIFGEDTLETDRFIRTMGWRRVAEQEWPLLEPATRAALTAYAEGVNAYIEDRSPSELAAEYSILGLTGLDYTPEEWQPVDSLAWLKAMAWDLRGNMEAEVDRVLLSLDHSEADDRRALAGLRRRGPPADRLRRRCRRRRLRAERHGQRDPQPPPSGVPPWCRRGARARAGPGRRDARAGWARGAASAATRGSSTASTAPPAQPLLANDPHLGISQPGIWMQMGLHCREASPDCTLDVSGFTFSGVPGVIIGHNADIAWGFTNLGPDVTDLFLEQTEGDDLYVRDGATEPLRVRTETIEVRGADDVELRVRETVARPADQRRVHGLRHGRRQRPDRRARRARQRVRRRAGVDRPRPRAHRRRDPCASTGASDWDEFRAAAADFAVPAQNLVYADREGHIGYQAPGRVPIRRGGNDGTMPSRAGSAPTTGPATTSPSTGCRACSTPRRASSSPPTRRSSTRTTPTC